MERLFFRDRQADEQTTESVRQQLHIAVTGLGRGVGTTFVAAALAFYFRDKGKLVSFCQCLTPSKSVQMLYDSVAMDQRFLRRTFCDVYEIIRKGEPVNSAAFTDGSGKDKRLNTEAGISWIIPGMHTSASSGEEQDLSGMQRARLLTIPKGEVCVFDFEAEYQWNQLLMDMDIIIVVVDPLPSKLIHSKARFKFLKKLELSGCDVLWLVNRNNDGVSMRQVKAYLKTGKLVSIPAFADEQIYGCEYACKFPWENVEIRRKMMEIFTLLFQKVSNYSIIL